MDTGSPLEQPTRDHIPKENRISLSSHQVSIASQPGEGTTVSLPHPCWNFSLTQVTTAAVGSECNGPDVFTAALLNLWLTQSSHNLSISASLMEKEGEDEQRSQDHEGLVHQLRQCTCSNGSSPKPAGLGLNEHVIKPVSLIVAANRG